LLIVHQQRFIGKTAVDIDISTPVQPLLILDPINWGPAFRYETTWQDFISLALNHRRTAKEATGAHVAATGTRHCCRRRCVGTSSPLSPPPCQDLFNARSTNTPHLYVLSGAAVDLWASLPLPSTSCRAGPPWGALPGEILFPPTLPLFAGSRSLPGCRHRCVV
jgi:hypothetical protein